MLARKAPRRHKNSGRPVEKQAGTFPQWVRGHECHVAHKGGCGGIFDGSRPKIEFAHVDHAGGKGIGTKVADRFGIPLCQAHAREQHGQTGPFRERGGWPTFQAKYGFDAVDAANTYWRDWPGRIAWERSCED